MDVISVALGSNVVCVQKLLTPLAALEEIRLTPWPASHEGLAKVTVGNGVVDGTRLALLTRGTDDAGDSDGLDGVGDCEELGSRDRAADTDSAKRYL